VSSNISEKGKDSPKERAKERMDDACDAEEKGQAGRPRCPVTHQNILKAACELVDEVGYANLTIEGIAARACVGKTTIYRRWPNKASIVMDAILEEVSPKIPFPDTGDTREDIRRQMRALLKELSGPMGRKIALLLANSQLDKEMAEAFRTRWIELRRAEAREVIRRGVERGELRRDIDAEALVDALYGPVYFRLLGGHAPLTSKYADALVELVMSGAAQSDS
jgi:AcrR family transcriptional regulator